ncbi:5,10-methylene-tetrahydrofolate dehydrogenase [Staphylococcus equorum]|uniref:5,10-methylene-tetrahydrofolate dehydrogenase n=1 Tax=Staphylococcus equorum TaxID=246432 RepID=A0A9X4LAQ0_9STAP|nr:5,10-methylene-tetrahydrofolate dehydrogenase [Staphylococcus equorum]MDG0844267.1 5,10-methylene-tetrahydrofolate dehydrogenase [Staphylococcus equorum]MDG0860075.1 5,10-methylene-tetrahydrofolate dehydrogenase [Staphylococcus equorum]
MTNRTIAIGLVAAPGITEKIAHNLENSLPDILANYFVQDIEWKIHTVVDPLTGSAETAKEIFEKIANYQNNNNWHYTIGLTDLPIIKENNVIAFDINKSNGASLISIPSYGWRPVQKRIQKSIVGIIETVSIQHSHNLQINNNNNNDKSSQEKLKSQFPLSTLKSRTEYLEDTNSKHTHYFVSSNTKGSFRLISGMTFANNPLNMLSSLSNVVAIAFTTGAFGIVFTTMWNLSYVYSSWRMLLMMLVAIFGMMFWIIVAHHLWESKKESRNKSVTMLYNLTTVLTLTISLIIYYIILFFLFLIATLVVLPSGYLGQTLQMGGSATLSTYINLAWFATSISTVAGAIGAGLNNEELILESTYGFRQKERYKKMEDQEKQQEQKRTEVKKDIEEKKQEEEQKAKQEGKSK